MEWQPIKTAPKDGTMILATLPDSDCCYTIEWADAEAGIRREAGEGIGWHHSWDGYFFQPYEQPTHWMPVPELPIDAVQTDSTTEQSPITEVTAK